MNRREAISALVAGTGVMIAAGQGTTARPTSPIVWGPMTVERHRALCDRGIHLHVYVAGVDVTTRCRFFDDTPSNKHADLFRHNSEGRPYLTRNHGEYGEGRLTMAAMEHVTDFEVREGAPFR